MRRIPRAPYHRRPFTKFPLSIELIFSKFVHYSFQKSARIAHFERLGRDDGKNVPKNETNVMGCVADFAVQTWYSIFLRGYCLSFTLQIVKIFSFQFAKFTQNLFFSRLKLCHKRKGEVCLRGMSFWTHRLFVLSILKIGLCSWRIFWMNERTNEWKSERLRIKELLSLRYHQTN